MKRKTLKPFSLAALPLLIFAFLAPNSGCRRNAPARQVVLIVIDTLRADHLPFYGYGKNTAPFLATLAARGVVFENVFSPSSWTAPATTSIFTSLYPFQHGVVTGILAGKDMKIELRVVPDAVLTIPEIMKEAGYRTYGAANNPNIGEEMGFTRGFDEFASFASDEEKEMFARLDSWADEIRKQDEYFLYIHFNDCHSPYVHHKPWFEKKTTPRENNLSAYDSEISSVDEKIRRLSDRYGWDENTLLIVASDHGEEFREHKGNGHGRTLYAEVIRVPMLFVFPGKEGPTGKRIGANVSTLDILPTLREYVGVKNDQTEEGMDLLPVMRGKGNKAAERDLYSHLLYQNREGLKKNLGAVIEGEWKYVFTDAGPKKSRRELFNLKNDPGDLRNLLKDNASAAGALARKYKEFEKNSRKFFGAAKNIELSRKKIEELRTLGYVR